MGKIAPISSKYIIHASIEIEGVVDRPDVIGAIFGQTEGLLGADLELRELQRSGRIGRIEVNVNTQGGKTAGTIIIPSSLDKAETSIVGASLEIIQRIGPCNAKLRVQNIEDVRISKRTFVIDRAKQLLRTMTDTTMPDSQELADEVSQSVRVQEITEFGSERLPAGPGVGDSDEVIVVEGRADVLNLLKHGFKNAIAINGTSCPATIQELSRKKDMVLFVDGDRGGNLIIKEMLDVTEVDFITRAPDGKEVEELTKKEIHKALRSRITAEQAKMETGGQKNSLRTQVINRNLPQKRQLRKPTRSKLPDSQKEKFGKMLESLVGTRGAFILDDGMNVLGKVPTTELATTIKSLNQGIYAVVMDGSVDNNIARVAESSRVKYIVATQNSAGNSRVNIVTANDL